MRTRIKSRVIRNLEKQSKRQIIVFIFGIIILLYLTLQYGIPLLGDLGGLISTIKEKTGRSKDQVNEYKTFLETPLLFHPFSATNSAAITISGKSASNDVSVELYLNNSLYVEITPEKDGMFSSEIHLKEGENTVKARTKKNKEFSDFTEDVIFTYIKNQPKLEVQYPSDNSVFSKDNQEIYIQGATETQNSVRINGFLAIVDHQGNFSYYYKLKDGENSVTIEAQDSAGNKNTKTLKILYQP